jgi:hypothetical protein
VKPRLGCGRRIISGFTWSWRSAWRGRIAAAGIPSSWGGLASSAGSGIYRGLRGLRRISASTHVTTARLTITELNAWTVTATWCLSTGFLLSNVRHQ